MDRQTEKWSQQWSIYNVTLAKNQFLCQIIVKSCVIVRLLLTDYNRPTA